jgi:hypothetical protein
MDATETKRWDRVIIYRVTSRGTMNIIKEDDGTYTVEESDLYRVHSSTSGFKSYKAAKREYLVGA